MKVFIKEALYLLDYSGQKKEVLFSSDQRDVAGFAYDVKINEHNTGHSSLSFTMPTSILQGESNITNPKIKDVQALSRIRYERTIQYTGEETITINVPMYDYGSETADKTYSNGDLLEEYSMDYIVQPLSLDREGEKITVQVEAIDYPRHVLSKTKVGININDRTQTTEDLTLHGNKPLDVPGMAKYIPWSEALNVIVGRSAQSSVEWNPRDLQYPLTSSEIQLLLDDSSIWDYGVLGTHFYWPITDTARFEGVQYREDNFIILNVFNTLLNGYTPPTGGTEESPAMLLGDVAVQWSQYYKGENFINPNNALNHLKFLLKNTSWEVATKLSINYIGEDGETFVSLAALNAYVIEHTIALEADNFSVVDEEVYVWNDEESQWDESTDEFFNASVQKTTGRIYDIDLETTELLLPRMAPEEAENVIKTCGLNLSDSNVYNGIVELSKELQLYPAFNCENKSVSLRTNPGKNSGLTYSYGRNIASNKATLDGEKIITKLYVSGAPDAKGSENINISEVERNVSGDKVYPIGQGKFTWLDYIPTSPRGIVCPKGKYITVQSGQEYLAGFYYKDGTTYKYCVTAPSSFVEMDETDIVTLVLDGTEYTLFDYDLNTITVEQWFNEWPARVVEYQAGSLVEAQTYEPNHAAYLSMRSPDNANYIYNFKYFYDKGILSRDAIVDIYRTSLKISDLNKDYILPYVHDFIKSILEYEDANMMVDFYSMSWQASFNTLMNTYYTDENQPVTQGVFHAFKNVPADAQTGAAWGDGSLEADKYYVKIESGGQTYGYVRTPIFPDGRANAGNGENPKDMGMAEKLEIQLGTTAFAGQLPALRALTEGEVLAISPNIASYDPSGLMTAYGRQASSIEEGYIKNHESEQAATMYLNNKLAIEVLLEEGQGLIQAEENYLTDSYGDYIIEGFFRDENQVFPTLLLEKGMEASDRFGFPDVSYELNVIDSAGLFEFRNNGGVL